MAFESCGSQGGLLRPLSTLRLGPAGTLLQHTPPGPAPIALPGPGGSAEDLEASRQPPALVISQETPKGADTADRGPEEGHSGAAPEQLIAGWLAAEAHHRRSGTATARSV